MYVMRIGERGAEIPVASPDRTTYADARAVTNDYHPEFFAGGGLARLRKAIESDELTPLDVGDQRIGAPIARPAAVICIGQNYAAHALESGSPPPTEPIIFFKHPNTLRGPMDPVQLPPGAEKVDWEVELAVILGSQARYLGSAAEVLACVAGYAVANDLSERAYQLDRSCGQWSKGKCCEDFLPLGPVLAVDEVADPQALGLRSWVNGEVRQASTTADMIFGVGEIVAHLSHFMVLSPGDLILTGTPQGVALSGRFPYVGPEDVMEIEIDGPGRQRQETIPARL